MIPEYDIESLLPHREPMLLLESIEQIDGDKTISKTCVRQTWPLLYQGKVYSFIIVELIAQTAGAGRTLKNRMEEKYINRKQGWIVGIKSALFHCEEIKVGSVLSIETGVSIEYENYIEITGRVMHESELIGEAVIQVFSLDI